MESVEHLKSLNEQVAEPYVRLALAYFSEHLASGKYSSPAIEHYNLKQIASRYLEWEKQERERDFAKLEIASPHEDDGNWPSSEDWKHAEQIAMGGLSQQEWDNIPSQTKASQDEEEESEGY
jgi:hypothetical protein